MHTIIPTNYITPKINEIPLNPNPSTLVWLPPNRTYALTSPKFFIYCSLLILRHSIVENTRNIVKHKCFNREYIIVRQYSQYSINKFITLKPLDDCTTNYVLQTCSINSTQAS